MSDPNRFFTHLFSLSEFDTKWKTYGLTTFDGWMQIVSEFLLIAGLLSWCIVLLTNKANATQKLRLSAGVVLLTALCALADVSLFWVPLHRVYVLLLAVSALIVWVLVIVGVVAKKHETAATGATALSDEEKGRITTAYGSMWQADLQEQTEAAKQQTILVDKFWRQIAEGAPNGILFVDESGVITYANKYAEQWAGGKLVAANMTGLIGDQWYAIKGAKRGAGPQEVKLANGGYAEMQIVVPEMGDGKNVVVYIMDITARMAADAELAKLKAGFDAKVTDRTKQLEIANSELEAFSYSVSHDLKAPLRIATGYAEMLLSDKKGLLDDEYKKMASGVVTNARQMGRVIDALLNLARLGKVDLNMHAVDMHAILHSSIDEQMTMKGGPIKFTIGEVLPAQCDGVLIRQVWNNLLSNAIKYSSKTSNPSIEIGSVRQGDYVEYYIKDNGVGFDMQYADKLFNVFYRLHKKQEYEGVGVGLALVQRILTKHNGMIWAVAAEGKGATFYFTLPA